MKRLLLAPLVGVFVVWEILVWAWTGKKPWRSPGRPTCGTVVFGWLGFDVTESEEHR